MSWLMCKNLFLILVFLLAYAEFAQAGPGQDLLSWFRTLQDNPQMKVEAYEYLFDAAVLNGDLEIVKLILAQQGLSKLLLNKNQLDHTVLHRAVMSGHTELVKFFLGQPNSEKLLLMRDYEQKTVLNMAVDRDFVEIIKLLLKHPASGNLLLMRYSSGQTDLHKASMFGKVAIVNLLLAHPAFGEIFMIQDREGKTALDWALIDGRFEVAQVLLTQPESPKLLLVPHHPSKGSLLATAVMGGNLKIVKLLLDLPGIVNQLMVKDIEGRTALHWASLRDQPDIVREFLKFKDQVSFTEIFDNQNTSAFGHAVSRGRSRVVDVFVKAGFSLDEVVINGYKTSALNFLRDRLETISPFSLEGQLELYTLLITGRLQSSPPSDWEVVE